MGRSVRPLKERAFTARMDLPVDASRPRPISKVPARQGKPVMVSEQYCDVDTRSQVSPM